MSTSFAIDDVIISINCGLKRGMCWAYPVAGTHTRSWQPAIMQQFVSTAPRNEICSITSQMNRILFSAQIYQNGPLFGKRTAFFKMPRLSKPWEKRKFGERFRVFRERSQSEERIRVDWEMPQYEEEGCYVNCGDTLIFLRLTYPGKNNRKALSKRTYTPMIFFWSFL